MTRHHPDDLDWLAFCYVAGEMEAAEAAAFQRRLEGDLAACEAVARAVELTQAVVLASDTIGGKPEPVVPASRGDRRPALWAGRAALVIAAAAACVAVVLLAPREEGSRRPPPVEGGAAASASADADVDPIGQLALVWSETGEELAALDSESWPVEASEPAEEDLTTEEDLTAVDPAADDESELAPSWMLAAVADLSQEPVSSLPIEPLREER